MTKTLMVLMALFSSGCGRTLIGQDINEAELAPAMPGTCTLIRTDTDGGLVGTARYLYVYSCTTGDPAQTYLQYVDKYGIVEKFCLDSGTHICQ